MKIYLKLLFYIIKLLSFIILLFTVSVSVNASFISDLFDNNGPEINYCQNDECGIDNGINQVGQNINGLVTDQTASSYFQNVVKYLLGFIYFAAIVLIIYAGVYLMTGLGNEERSKKSKTMIIYVIIGIIIIFSANSIIAFVLKVLKKGA